MFGWRRPLGLTLVLTGLALPTARSSAQDQPITIRQSVTDPAKLRTQAEAAERDGRWEDALDLYLKLYISGKGSGDLRERIRICLRNAAQLRRHRDPAFQQYVLSLPAADALNLYLEVVGKLGTTYVDGTRSTPGRLFALGLDEFDRALSEPEFRKQHLDRPADGRVSRFQRLLRDDWKARLPATAAEARQAVKQLALDARSEIGVKNPSAVVFEFLCGACTGLDEYTMYLSPGGLQAELASPILELATYGVLIRFAGADVVVDGLVPLSWAAMTNLPLRKGDRIVRVNGKPVDGHNPAGLAAALREPVMYAHEIEVRSADALVRLPVPAPTVFAADILESRDGVGYVRLAAFRDTTPRELDDALYNLQNLGMRVLILDVRGNPGGSLPAALQVAQRFLPSGIVITTQGQSPEFSGRVFSSDSGMTALELPVVLLIDAKTMSAAEAIAASWKDHGRATLVGLPTFGKGVVQAPVELRGADTRESGPRSGVLILTVASMFGPSGSAIHGVGVVPHVIEVDPTRQLQKAVELAAGMR